MDNNNIAEEISAITRKLHLMVGEIINKTENERGRAFATAVEMSLISQLICNRSIVTLNSKPKGQCNKEAQANHVFKKYRDYKAMVANCVGVGLSAAMTAFSGVNVEYHCQIMTVPEPINDLPA